MRIIALKAVVDGNMFHISDLQRTAEFHSAKSTMSMTGFQKVSTGSPPSLDIEKSFCVSVVHSKGSKKPS